MLTHHFDQFVLCSSLLDPSLPLRQVSVSVMFLVYFSQWKAQYLHVINIALFFSLFLVYPLTWWSVVQVEHHIMNFTALRVATI